MNRNVLVRAVIIALLWMASSAPIPGSWDTWVRAPLQVLPFLDPTGAIAGIAIGALVKGLAEFNAMVRLPSEVEIHKIYSGVLVLLINGSSVLAAIFTARTRRVWIAPLPAALANVAVVEIYMRTSPYSIVAVAGWRDLLRPALISYVVGLVFFIVALNQRQVRRALVRRGEPGRL